MALFKTSSQRFITIIAYFSLNLVFASSHIDTQFNQIKKNPLELQAFLYSMPKGGDLHVHFDGSMSANTLIRMAKKENYCVDPQTAQLSEAKNCQGVPINLFLKKPSHRKQLIDAWSMGDMATNDPRRYDHFFDVFSKVNVIYRDFSTPILAQMIQTAADQHLLYLEIMRLHNIDNDTFAPSIKDITSFNDKRKVLLANPKVQQRIQDQITLATEALSQARQFIGCEKKPHLPACSVTVKFQYFTLRAQPINHLFVDALIGFEAAEKSPLIVGVNIVQPEKAHLAAENFQQELDIFDFLHQHYPDVPLALHAGELRLEMTADPLLKNHIQETINRGHAQRIGHGTALFAENHYADLVQQMAKQSIAVEINLTSNQDILRIEGTQHPFLYYLHHHVPVVLSTDDAGISETNLSKEYLRATQRYDLDYQTIKQINRNSLTYSFLPGKSLWLNAPRHIPVPACQMLSSKICLKWIENNPKAQLQWKLEKKLIDFESNWVGRPGNHL